MSGEPAPSTTPDSKCKVYMPPSTPPTSLRSPSIFLAGSIEMGKATDWQSRLTNALSASTTPVSIFNPRRTDWDSSWEQDISNPHFRGQVEWEMDQLDRADLIVLYFEPGTQSPISLLELGLHAASGKVVCCCPEGFWRRGNVQVVCARFGIKLFVDDFKELVEYVVTTVRKL